MINMIYVTCETIENDYSIKDKLENDWCLVTHKPLFSFIFFYILVKIVGMKPKKIIRLNKRLMSTPKDKNAIYLSLLQKLKGDNTLVDVTRIINSSYTFNVRIKTSLKHGEKYESVVK